MGKRRWKQWLCWLWKHGAQKGGTMTGDCWNMFKIMNMPDDPVYSILGEMDFTYAQDRQVVLVRETCRNANALNV